ncbi:hypothetical protein GCM10027444_31830 [Actinopolyspora lacussalsi]
MDQLAVAVIDLGVPIHDLERLGQRGQPRCPHAELIRILLHTETLLKFFDRVAGWLRTRSRSVFLVTAAAVGGAAESSVARRNTVARLSPFRASAARAVNVAV